MFSQGWTKYPTDGPPKQVSYPDEQALVFDVEVCVPFGKNPVLACAVGPNCWYSWVSYVLIDHKDCNPQKLTLKEMIPLESTNYEGGSSLSGKFKVPRIVVGHNVSYDRARIKEQYWLENTALRFLDTMTLHVCVSGVTSYQRAMLKSSKELQEEDLGWSSQSSLNSLAEVYRLYCNGELAKDRRNTFMEGNLEIIRDDFQNLMNYCASDVLATNKVLKVLYPLFQERFSHPATLAGMLELGSAYLPVNTNWNRYINESNLTYEDLDIESKCLLSQRADNACKLAHNEEYKKDLWMWDQDWSVQALKLKNATKSKKNEAVVPEIPADPKDEFQILSKKFQPILKSSSLLPARRPLLPGYPLWYRKLCLKPSDPDWSPEPTEIGTAMQVAPKLLCLCWEGYPLHYLKGHGWGFLVPNKSEREEDEDGELPLEELVKKCPVMETCSQATATESAEAMKTLWKDVEMNLSRKDYYSRVKKDQTNGVYKGTGVWCNQDLENCCWFLKLPHKNGPSNRVGNPLAKDFLNKFSENVLSGEGRVAERIIEIARMLSYWRNNRDRIMGQIVGWLSRQNLPKQLKNSDQEFGAIIPQVVVCGTLTRRAMEPTWMTASNAQKERVGSELRSMVQAPDGYKIVGADVDSQELWIASILGDSTYGVHGATPFGWMSLSGSKSAGSDMHTNTAKAVGISRDHAKVINYARIYGAGQNFAERLLKQFNPTFSDGEAKSKAMKMFAITKGRKQYYLLPEYLEEYSDKGYSSYEAVRMAAMHKKPLLEMFFKPQWRGGTESAMFNRLEEIAGDENPETPFLQCRLSRALEPQAGTEDRFLTTRINWVVQSGAVDFLHLMLVCMRWLMKDKIRFCLSFHDEIRYLVPDQYAYQTALAMHVTNLLTRSFCVSRIGMHDLPRSIAFFTSVEIDRVLRKEAHLDCKTPSNPHGLSNGYGIEEGDSLDINQTIEKVGNDLSHWKWHKIKSCKASKVVE